MKENYIMSKIGGIIYIYTLFTSRPPIILGGLIYILYVLSLLPPFLLGVVTNISIFASNYNYYNPKNYSYEKKRAF